MKKLMFAALVSCFSVSAFAACADSQQQCVIYKDGNVAAESGQQQRVRNGFDMLCRRCGQARTILFDQLLNRCE